LIWINWGSFEIWKIHSLDDPTREHLRSRGLVDANQAEARVR
jgi:hypothetical protein